MVIDLKNDRKLTPIEAAEMINRRPSTLARWRSERIKGPPWYGGGAGCLVHYLESDLVEWLKSQRRGPIE